jgi:glycogen operon protein
MLLGGDELARSQGGNNNAYCQDNELSWYDWENPDEDLRAFVKGAIALRRQNHALRPRDYLRGPEGGQAQIVLYRPDGKHMGPADWENPSARALCVALDGRQIEGVDGGTTSDRFVLFLNGHDKATRFTVPPGHAKWDVVLTTGRPDKVPRITSRRSLKVDREEASTITARRTVAVGPRSLLLLRGV